MPNTTPATAPYGIVQLADATDEGWGCNMRQMHWAETGNHGVVPNPAFPDAFVAAAHDLGEPWDDGCKGAPNWCCVCANATKSPACVVGVDTPFNVRPSRWLTASLPLLVPIPRRREFPRRVGMHLDGVGVVPLYG